MSQPEVSDQQMRRDLRLMLEANRVAPDRATLVVDLAVHAADAALAKLSEVIKTAPDGGVGLMAFEIALQLARARCDGSFERTRALGRKMGVPQYEAAIGIVA